MMLKKDQIWVSSDPTCENPYLRKEFRVESPASGQISICGLGFFELYLNGRRVSDDVMKPAFTDYEKRENRRLLYPLNDETTHRVYYCTYDVSAFLLPGRNTLGVLLANGWYNQHERNIEGSLWFGHPKLCFTLTGKTQSGGEFFVCVDETMRWAQSPLIYDNIFYGERYNYRFRQPGWCENGFDDSSWRPVRRVEGPDAIFEEQTCPPDRVVRTVAPRYVREFCDCKIYDAGENMTGWARLRYTDPDGGPVRVRYAEELNEDGSLNLSPTGGDKQVQQDEFAGAAPGDILEPRFSWKGFRYFEVTGYAEPLECAVVHTDVRVNSSFESDNETLNWLVGAYLRTQLANIHTCVPMDCPHRERLGYTGDGQLTSDVCMLLTDSAAFYRKWMQDIADGQDVRTGHIQHTAPFMGGGGGPVGWGGAIVFVPYNYYQHFGDRSVLEKYYGNMLRYLAYLRAHTEDGLITSEEPGGWCLGDWNAPEPIAIPEPYVNTYFYIKALACVIEISQVLGRDPGIDLAGRMEESRRALVKHYYDAAGNTFCGGVQGADAFAAELGLANPAILGRLNEHYKKTRAFDTGIFGTEVVVRTLFEHGYAQTAVDLLASHAYPSFGYMMDHNATTLWEQWDGVLSHNHPMFGSCIKYLYYYLLGIRQNPGCTGYHGVTIAPVLVDGVSRLAGHIEGAGGVIAVRYEKAAGMVAFTVTVGEGVRGSFVFGGGSYPLRAGEQSFSFTI
jgi:alpha-L-rhamnosidase